MVEVVTIIFWGSAFLLLFPYLIYPLLLLIAPAREYACRDDYEPELSIIIAAYNEELGIAEKIENTLTAAYPPDKRTVIVASDHSTDATDEIVRSFAPRGVKLVRLDRRGGKTAAQNAALEHASGEVLVFTDCGTHLEPEALRQLVIPLSDPDTGCSGGYLEFVSSRRSELARRKKLLTDFGQWLKAMESSADSLVGVNGALYAWRKDIARQLPSHLTSDLTAPLDTIARGGRVAFAPQARGHEAIAASEGLEFSRKIRTARAGITAAKCYLWLFFDIRRPWVALALWGHKGLRWLGLPLMMALFLANMVLLDVNPLYHWAMAIQGLFYLLCVLGWIGLLRGKLRTPYYFVFLNLAALIALVQSLVRPPSETWETAR